MIYVLALVGAATIAVLMWKAFGPERPLAAGRPTVAPDDDPDFLRGLGRDRKDPDDDPT